MPNHLRQFLLLAAVAVTLTYTTGCATIFSGGGTQHTRIESTPPGATVVIKNEVIGKTPVTIAFSKKRPRDGMAELQLAGYQAAYAVPHMEANPFVFLNIFNLWIGGIVDGFVTGAAIKYDDVVHVRLRPLSEGAGENSTTNMNAATLLGLSGKVTPSSAADTPAQKLKQLKDLKDSGMLTEEEYSAKRKALVEKL